MAVANSLAKVNTEPEVKYLTPNGEEIKLKPSIVKSMLVNGNGAITNGEINMFLSLCKFQKLNPFLKEVYLIKYGNSPATMVVGKEVLLKRAMRSPKYQGSQAGVIVVDGNGKLTEREGTFILDGESLVGGWAKVFISGYSAPIYASVSIKEYSTGQSNWKTKPATMIRKVALAQALREAFPEDTAGLYEASEMDKTVVETTGQEIVVDETPIAMPAENAVETPVQSVVAEKVITPAQNTASENKGNSDGQGSIDDIMFGNQTARGNIDNIVLGSQAASLVGDVPFEV